MYLHSPWQELQQTEKHIKCNNTNILMLSRSGEGSTAMDSTIEFL